MRLSPIIHAALALSLALLPACGGKPDAPAKRKDGGTANPPAAGHGGPVIELGTSTIGPFDVMATRDEGRIIAGKDAPIDVTVSPAAGSSATTIAVRFWIGTEDAAGSVKARAEIENPAEPNRWHTHAEVPEPLPEGSMLWVEIEDETGAVHRGSFDLNA